MRKIKDAFLRLRAAIGGLSLLAWCLLISAFANVTTAALVAWFVFARPVVNIQGSTEVDGTVDVRGSVDVEGPVYVANPPRGEALDVRITGR
jgi:hypothetical protein